MALLGSAVTCHRFRFADYVSELTGVAIPAGAKRGQVGARESSALVHERPQHGQIFHVLVQIL